MLAFLIAAVLSLAPADKAEPAATPRPLLHFTPEKNWTNDPNGLIYVDGEYHLFYQYNPFGDQWGHMSWGHAVSKDLFAWEHLPVAIPESNGIMAFSGTAVFDRDNTSGFGIPGHPPLIAIYTGHQANRQDQRIASGTDRGRTFTQFAGNPVIDLNVAEFRDPKVFWHTPTKRWIMVVSLATEKKALFYSSLDLKKWDKLSEFGPQGRGDIPNWECPDFFELPIDGDAANTRWILVINVGGNGPSGGSGVQYFVGKFDGEKFTNDNPTDQVLWLDRGKDFYAFQTFNDAPHNKRIGLAWMANTHYAGRTPTSPWRGAMTVSREFKLSRTAEGLRVTQMPIAGVGEFLISRKATETTLAETVIKTGNVPIDAKGQVAFIEAEFEPGTAEKFGIRVREHGEEFTAIGYDAKSHEMYIDRSHSGNIAVHPQFSDRQVSPLAIQSDGRIKLTIVVDQCSVEAFGNSGYATITSLIFPKPMSSAMSIFAEGGDCKLVRLKVISLETK